MCNCVVIRQNPWPPRNLYYFSCDRKERCGSTLFHFLGRLSGEQKKTSLQNPILVQSVLFSLCSRPLGLRGEGGGVSPLFTLWKFCVTSQVDPVSILLTVRAQGMAMSPVFCRLQCYLNLENVFCHHKKITRPCLNYR